MTIERDDLDAILDALPPDLCQRVRALPELNGILEIVMDLGRTPEARFAGREEILSHREVTAGTSRTSSRGSASSGATTEPASSGRSIGSARCAIARGRSSG